VSSGQKRDRPAGQEAAYSTSPGEEAKNGLPLAKYIDNLLDNFDEASPGVGIPSANRWTPARHDRLVIVLDAEQGTSMQWRLRVRPTWPGIATVH
jgi:hypothetical protein